MKIVVTGGSGNVGRYVVDELRKFHHEVTVFDVKESKERTISPLPVFCCSLVIAMLILLRSSQLATTVSDCSVAASPTV